MIRALVLSIALMIGGCSHYYLPTTRLETPEVLGDKRFARVDLALQSGVDLGKTAGKSALVAKPALGVMASSSQTMELGFRIQPSGPFALRLKRQFSGPTEIEAKQGDFSTALSAGTGILLGRSSTQNTSIFSGDLAFIAGYRVWDRHLLYLSPFVTAAKLSGVPNPARSDLNSTVTQIGAGLGYQYKYDALFCRGETTFSQGSYSTGKFAGLFFGASAGFEF